MKAEGSCGFCGHEMVEFRILREESRAKRKTTALDLRMADFNNFRNPFGKIPWHTATERR